MAHAVGLLIDEQIATYVMAVRGLLTQNAGKIVVGSVVEHEKKKTLVARVGDQIVHIAFESRLVVEPESCKKMAQIKQKRRWFVREDA